MMDTDMITPSLRTPLLRGVLLVPGVLLLLMWIAAKGQAPAPNGAIPTLPGVGFAMIGMAPGETLRLNALNSAPAVPLQAPAGCQVPLQTYDPQGPLVTARAN